MPEIELNGEIGNAFSLIGTVSNWFRQVKVPQSYIDETIELATAGDYENLLSVLQKRCAEKHIELTYTKDGEEYTPLSQEK